MKTFNKTFFLFFLLLAAVGFFSCRKKITNRADLIEYINNPENGLKKTEQIGPVKVALTYKPWQLTVLNQLGNKGKSGNKDKPAITNFTNKLFFVLSLSANNKEILRQVPFSQYSEMVQVLAFRMKEFVELIPDEGKPIEPLDCLFQQTYGMGIANNVLIVFDKQKLLEADNLNIKIKEFGLNTGNLSFNLQTKDINDIQNIAIK